MALSKKIYNIFLCILGTAFLLGCAQFTVYKPTLPAPENNQAQLTDDTKNVFSPSEEREIPTHLLVAESNITRDPLSRFQWGLATMLDGCDYWELQQDAPRDVVVALIDSQVHMDHPDLVRKQVAGWNFTKNSPVMTFPYDKNSPNASNLHGQCAASIIAAETDNNIGMAGVFSRAYIMPIQAGKGHTAQALNWAIEHQADVIVLYNVEGALLGPMGGDSVPDPTLATSENITLIREIKAAFQRAYENNIPIISGVSNKGTFDISFTADDPRVISVGAHNVFGEASFPNSFSYTYEIFAPGGSRAPIHNREELSQLFPKELAVFDLVADYDDPICAIGPKGYSFLTLGSAAIPHVAGAVALIKSYLPDASVSEIREILLKSTHPLTPTQTLLEALGGQVSLRLVKEEIGKRKAKARKM